MDEIDAITEDELVAALLSAQTTGAAETTRGALTTRALAKMVKRRRNWVCERLRDLIGEGRVECVTVQIIDIAGRTTTVPAYKLKAEE